MRVAESIVLDDIPDTEERFSWLPIDVVVFSMRYLYLQNKPNKSKKCSLNPIYLCYSRYVDPK